MRTSLLSLLLLCMPVMAEQTPYDAHCDVPVDAPTQHERLRQRALMDDLDPLTWVKCDNWASFTIYDRDVEGIPRAAWAQIGQLMDCVRDGRRFDPIEPIANDLDAIEATLEESVRTMRHDDDIAGGTMLIYRAVRQVNQARIYCPRYGEPT